MIATFDFINHASGVALAAILNTALAAFAAAAIVWIALRFTPRVNAATRHAAWWAVLALVAIVPVLPQSFTPAPRSAAPPVNSVLQTRAANVPIQSPANHEAASTNSKQLVSRPLPPDSGFASSQNMNASAARPSHSFLPFEFRAGNWPGIIFAVWVSVFVLLMARVVSSYAHLRAVRNRAYVVTGQAAQKFEQCLQESRMTTQPWLLASREIFSPLAAGFLHPVVILPEQLLNEMSESELEAVLLHELAHFARGDNWTNLLARLAAPVMILHPVAAWALVRIEREREIACDDWAVSISGSPRKYAATLARLFEVCGARRRELLATGMAHRTSRLGDRIEMLLRPKREFAARTSLTRLGLCAAAGLVILAAGTQLPGLIAFAQDSPAAPAVVITAKRLTPSTGATKSSPLVQATQAMPTAQANSALPARDQSGSASLSNFSYGSNVSIDPPGAPQEFGRIGGPGWTPEWKIDRSRSRSSGEVHLSVGYKQGGSEWIDSTDVPVSRFKDFSLAMLDKSGPIKFGYVLPAGELICEGNVSNGRAYGTFTVTANPEFMSAVRKLGYPEPDDRDVASLVINGITLEFARDVKSTGLNLTLGELGELSSHDVSAGYIRQARQAGLTKLSAEDFCELRSHGVEPEYLKQILEIDPKLSAEDISDLRTHGVEADYYKKIVATDVSISIDDITSLRTHGVEPDYFKRVHEANGKLSIDEIDELRTHGVEPESLKGYESADSRLTIDEITNLRTHGVEPEYLKEIRANGSNASIDEICELRTHGVEPGYLKEIQAADGKLTAEEISNLRTHGVEADYFKEMKSVDAKFSIEQICDLRTHGVEPSYVKEIKTADPKAQIEEMTELRTHGVPASFVSQSTRMGYHFTAEELSELWTHGVDEAYLRNLQDLGMKNLSSEQILKLRGR
jgi:beta-lactamase regulating signal transducer with metallopeptidase domain